MGTNSGIIVKQEKKRVGGGQAGLRSEAKASLSGSLSLSLSFVFVFPTHTHTENTFILFHHLFPLTHTNTHSITPTHKTKRIRPLPPPSSSQELGPAHLGPRARPFVSCSVWYVVLFLILARVQHVIQFATDFVHTHMALHSHWLTDGLTD
jgi:hypothetical protein